MDVQTRLLQNREVREDCWLWTGMTFGKIPYGRISVRGKKRPVHIVAHELWVGPVPAGYEVDHVKSRGCFSTLCFRPSHLEAVPKLTNIMRSDCAGAVNARKTHCVNGHEFSPENTYDYGYRRSCKTCTAQRDAAKREVAHG